MFLVRRGGYQYQDNCYEIFEKFFLKNNPFYDIVDGKATMIEGSCFGTAFGGMNQPKPEKLDDVEVTVECSLQEFYNGAKKEVKYQRQVVGLDGRTITTEDASVTVFVRPGMLESAKLCLRGKGNEQPKQRATDLYVRFKQTPCRPGSNSALFERRANKDLIYTHKCSLIDLIQCKPVQLTTLDNRTLLISLDQVLSPNSVKLVQGEGLPIDPELTVNSNEKERVVAASLEGKKGDLYIKFEVSFPTSLSKEQKDEIAQILGES